MADATGRTPRMITSLAKFLEPGATLDEWVDEEARFLLGEFQKFVALAYKEGRLSQVHAFLRWFFSPMLSPQPNIGASLLFFSSPRSLRYLLGCWVSLPQRGPPLPLHLLAGSEGDDGVLGLC